MSLTFIVPGWHAAGTARPPDEAPHQVPGMAWQVRRDAAPCWRTAVWNALACDATPGTAIRVPAANDWTARTGRPPPPGRLLRADPVSLLADRDTAILRPPASLALSEAESARLVATLNELLADDARVLEAPTPCDWYLSGPGLPTLARSSPDALAFQPFDPMQVQEPSIAPARADIGTDTEAAAWRRLRTLLSEVEMVLHTHPVNQERRARGLLAVTGLYPWGAAGEWPRGSSNPAGRLDAIIGDEPFVRAAASACAMEPIDDVPGPVSRWLGADRHALVIDLSLLVPWLSGDESALEAARSVFAERRLQPLIAAGHRPGWHDAGPKGAASGLRILAEAGWCHRAQDPPGGIAARSLNRLLDRLRGLSPGRARS